MIFQNRQDAGAQLAERLLVYKADHPIVIALPRGGVPVAAEVARRLEAPLDVLIVRKVGAPENPEYAIGALAEGGELWIREGAVRELGVTAPQLQALEARQQEEIVRRMERYRGGRPMVDVRGRLVLVVDDGLATGATMMAAVRALKAKGASRIVVAVPAAATSSATRIRSEVEAVVAIIEREDFHAIGQWYYDFSQVGDEEVVSILASSRPAQEPRAGTRQIEIAEGPLRLPGDLTQPEGCKGWVLFAHGSGSSRKSPRNTRVARTLNEAGLGTLLFDLLMPDEEDTRANVFDVRLLTERLLLATRWLRERAGGLPIGYFGASTGAAAALCAAAEPDNPVFAVVSRGGRPDLAGSCLPRVQVPVLLIVGGYDETVLRLNEEAARSLPKAKLVVVPKASHLFEEPGTLSRAIEHAVRWFTGNLSHAPHAPSRPTHSAR
jgi:predicted phosphoribosyltransferase/dienelactone hydrolase